MKNLFKLFTLLLFAVCIVLACTKQTPFDPEQGKNMEYVDLGLSVLWAKNNIGAVSPIESGSKFAWGEISTKEEYDWSNYQWCKNGSNYAITKYNNFEKIGKVDNKLTLDPGDDAASTALGNGWRMPTVNELQELLDNCVYKQDENGIYYFYNPKLDDNGNRVYPDAIYFAEGIWTASVCEINPQQAYNFLVVELREKDANGNEIKIMKPTTWHRSKGYAVRPVKNRE